MRDVLWNPEYAGAYVYGRYRYEKGVTADGQIKTTVIEKPMDEWEVLIKDHHEGYVSWEAFLENRRVLAKNQTNGKDRLLPGPAREGLALLQGLLVCADCGHKIYLRYQGNGGIYPVYQCTWRKREGLSHQHCLNIACRILDDVIGERIVEILQPAEIKLAVRAFEELERRTGAIERQWQFKIERAEYEAQLAQRRYEEVDPANRLVAATLEKRWNDTLVDLEAIRQQYEAHQHQQALAEMAKRKSEILALGEDLPRLWRSKTTQPKDRKRILRLLIKDITVHKPRGEKQVNLQIRWQGGATEAMCIAIPPNASEKWRHSSEIVDRVREMANTLTDLQIAKQFNAEALKSNKGNVYTASSIAWIRYKHRIPAPQLKRPDEMTVKELAAKLDVSPYVIYYWIDRKMVKARRVNAGSPWWITLDKRTEETLCRWAKESLRIAKVRQSQKHIAGGAL